MVKKNKYTRIGVLSIAATTLTMAGMLISPQAMARSKHTGVKTNANRVTVTTNDKVNALEAKLQTMEAELNRLKAENNRPVSNAESSKVQELDQWMNSVKSEPKESKKSNDNMVFFRGGYAHLFHGRNDLFTGGQTILNSGSSSQSAWNLGAGFDFSLSDNLFGFADKTEVLAELMFEYKNYGKQHTNATSAVQGTNPLCATTALAGGANPNITGQNCHQVTVTQFTLAASPKIKFLKGSAFRPWIIPVGLGLHVISPPSNGTTYINPGAMFAVGADYNIWKDIYIGADARYHWTANNADGVKTDGITVGGYLGIGF